MSAVEVAGYVLLALLIVGVFATYCVCVHLETQHDLERDIDPLDHHSKEPQ